MKLSLALPAAVLALSLGACSHDTTHTTTVEHVTDQQPDGTTTHQETVRTTTDR